MVTYLFGHGNFPSRRTPGRFVLEDIAASHGATARQPALRSMVRRPAVFTIPKASSVEDAEDNAVIASLQLSDAEHARIDAAFLLGSEPSRLPTL